MGGQHAKDARGKRKETTDRKSGRHGKAVRRARHDASKDNTVADHHWDDGLLGCSCLPLLGRF